MYIYNNKHMTLYEAYEDLVLQIKKPRPKELGVLVVIGGPGASGSSTIAKMIAEELDLEYIYAGAIMRKYARDKGFDSLDVFMESAVFKENHAQFDLAIERELLTSSQNSNVLIDSKLFAAMSTILEIPTTAKIWLGADIDTRVNRFLSKNELVPSGTELQQIKIDLQERFARDAARYLEEYSIDYTKPEIYNDFVLDTSKIGVQETLDLVLEKLKTMGVKEIKKEESTPDISGPGELDEDHPEDFDRCWISWKCLECNYVYEGVVAKHVCPKCGNDDPDRFD